MRRVAVPVLPTVTWLRFASRIIVVGTTALAVTVTMLTPLAASTLDA